MTLRPRRGGERKGVFKTKEMASSRVKESGLKQEAAGIVLLAFAVYIAISLFSYTDASNWGGLVGGLVSWGLLTSIGYTSYTFPFFLIVISFKFLLRRILTISLNVLAGFALFIPAFSAFLSEVFGPEAGGLLGGWLGGFLSAWLGATGAVIILLAVVLISFIVATGISFIQAGIRTVPPALALIQSMGSWIWEMRALLSGQPQGAPGEEKKKKKREEKEAAEEKAAYPAIVTPKINDNKTRARKETPEPVEEQLEFSSPKGSFRLPSSELLDQPPEKAGSLDSKALLENSKILNKTLLDFGIEGRVLEVHPGPVVTMYEFEPAPGVKVGRILNLSDDLALAMKALSIRIIAPIPGKSVVGIEVPNHVREKILLREMVECQAFSKSRSRLSLALGKDISGGAFMADLARMPHLLIAGATGTGKSIAVNAMVLSILFKSTPEDVRFLMVDPKMLELSAYEGIPHLITPVITEPKRAAVALKSIVAEMGKRYKLMAVKGAKNIEMYNRMVAEPGSEDPAHRRLPYIVVIIDELADLMMTSGKDVEECLVRLSQMARASGIHLIVATQRPSVDVVTGLIKTNFPSRIAFQLPTRTDSRTILDTGGAETLLGEGDMLFLPPHTSKLQRIHGVYVSETEIKKVAEFWKNQGTPSYDSVVIDERAPGEFEEEDLGEEFMARYREAVELASGMEMISTSYLQRRFRIGYNTAARMIEMMETEGIVGPSQGSRPREVLKRPQG